MNTQTLSEALSASASVAYRIQAKVSQVSVKKTEIRFLTEWLGFPTIQSEGNRC